MYGITRCLAAMAADGHLLVAAAVASQAHVRGRLTQHLAVPAAKGSCYKGTLLSITSCLIWRPGWLQVQFRGQRISSVPDGGCGGQPLPEEPAPRCAQEVTGEAACHGKPLQW